MPKIDGPARLRLAALLGLSILQNLVPIVDFLVSRDGPFLQRRGVGCLRVGDNDRREV